MKTILAPTDFSPAAENAVNYAAELAMMTNSKLILFHSYTIPVPATEVPVVALPFEELEKQNTELLKELDKRLKIKFPSITTELITKPGFVVDEISTLEENKHVDLVVMGLTGAGRTAALFGSNTTSVMKKSSKPVLGIPQKMAFKKPERVALACDYRGIVPDHVVDSFKEFVKLFGAKVLVFDVLKKAELVSYEKASAEVNLENSLGDVEHSLYFPSGDDLPEQVNEFVERNNVDVLAVMPHNYTFFSGLFHRSDTKKIALKTHIPILSIHE